MELYFFVSSNVLVKFCVENLMENIFYYSWKFAGMCLRVKYEIHSLDLV